VFVAASLETPAGELKREGLLMDGEGVATGCERFPARLHPASATTNKGETQYSFHFPIIVSSGA
jgi:hypothetical protein